MAVGIAIVGRTITGSYGGAELQGNVNKSLSFNGEPHDVTDDSAAGWQVLAAAVGRKDIEFGAGGLFQNLELVSVFMGASQAVQVIFTFPDGGTTLTVDAVMSALSIDMESDTPSNWTASFKSSAAPIYVAAT